QACSRCGYVDPRNRRDTQTFVCQACGHRGNAQVNAARNLLRRSSPEESVITFTPKRETLRLLLRRYAERSRPGSRLRPGIPGGRSAALEQVWGKNPYLKGFPDLLRTLGG
ncbi:zinc ribbon domain-containing protein, partial [Acinetobacter baumannii]